MQTKPLLGITMGDPAGIGPEIIVKALSLEEIYAVCRPLVIGDYPVMQDASEHITGLRLKLRRLDAKTADRTGIEYGTIDVLDLANVDLQKLEHGKVSAMGGRACYQYIEKAIQLALEGELDGTVTGPIHKEALNEAGYSYSGHTEIYADLTHTKEYAMMLVTGSFRVVHVSTHVSLREAVDRVKRQRVLEVINLAYATLRRLGSENPRIGVAGLNPHASDGGLFGNEEQLEITPAIEQARAAGLHVDGPLPPDTCFAKTRGGQYDIAVAMYHDQGHIPMKMVGFIWNEAEKRWSSVTGVNVTLGLPIVRTSVDHGVAFGKAGRGTASAESLVAAIHVARDLVGCQR